MLFCNNLKLAIYKNVDSFLNNDRVSLKNNNIMLYLLAEKLFFVNFRFQRACPVDLQRFVIGNDLAKKHVAQDVYVVERQCGKSVRCSRQFRHCTNTFPRMYSVEIALQGMYLT